MKIKLLLIPFIFTSFLLKAQTNTSYFHIPAGHDWVSDIVQMPDGHFMLQTTGTYEYLFHTDSQFSFLWAKKYSLTSESIEFKTMLKSKNNGVYMLGNTDSLNLRNILLMKVDSV